MQPKASVAANTGAGPDLFWGLYSLPHLFPQKCVDVTDVADYLGKKYGGWVAERGDLRQERQQVDRSPICYSGNLMNYRIEASKKAGFSKFPGHHRRVPRIRQGDEEATARRAAWRSVTPRATATPGSIGACGRTAATIVDKNDKVIINSPETEKALNYAKQLYDEMIPGTASWNDASNNKAFLGGEIHWTNNGISIYVAANNDPTKKNIAEDMDHADMPIGPIGKPTELHLMFPMLAMTYTKYPQACKALMAFMLEADQFNKWIEASQGYLTHCLNAYDDNPVWTADPKRTMFRDVAKRTLTAGGLGSVGEKAAAAIADFVLLDMFASYCTGREDAKARHEDRRAAVAADLSVTGFNIAGRGVTPRPGRSNHESNMTDAALRSNKAPAAREPARGIG